MWLCALCSLCALYTVRADAGDLAVLRERWPFDETRTLTLNSSVEYILDFVPTGDEGSYPARVWLQLSAGTGDALRPLLVTARQRAGAQTWQLPYYSGELLLRELERTLCRDDETAAGDGGCSAPDSAARGQIALHVASACAEDIALWVRVSPQRDASLPYLVPRELRDVRPAAPRVHRYEFAELQERVRLVVESEDDVCATVAVLDYTCPVPQTLSEVSRAEGGLRMTVMRSGGVQVERSRFPRGFLLVVVVHEDDTECVGAAPDEPLDWLYQSALGLDEAAPAPRPAPRRYKDLTVTVIGALSRAQYAVAAVVTLAVFLGFYVAFGAVVLAQRWAPCARLIRTRDHGAEGGAEGAPPTPAAPEASPPTMHRRRGSDVTFDSSDNSDSDGDDGKPRAVNDPPTDAPEDTATAGTTDVRSAAGHEVAATPSSSSTRPFGLPERLTLAALARRRAVTLRARSDRYLQTLYTVAVFYALPVVQFVAAFQLVLNVSGSLDLCYYNFLCAHPAGALSDFNHVFSNLGYLLLGALFMVQVARRRAARRRRPERDLRGIPPHYGLLSSLGAGMMVVALLSASYHVCPNQLNFQFDTAFMYVLAVLSMVKIYQARHPDINARAHATFGVLAVLIALVVWAVLGGGAYFWALWTALHVFTFLLLSLRIYYVGQFRLEKGALSEAARGLGAGRQARPLYSARLVLLIIANAINWAFALYGLLTMPADFAGHLLSLLLCNTLLHMSCYLSLKLVHGERLRWYAWLYLGLAAAAWAPSLYFFTYGSSDWSATPAQSRHSNHACKLLQFYDSHDLWHMLSAAALYLSFNAMLTWDDGLSHVPREQIAVF